MKFPPTASALAVVLGSLLVSGVAVAAGGGHHGGGEPHVNWFGWDAHAPPVGWYFVNFVIFVALLVKFAGKPMKAAMEKRHLTIKTQVGENQEVFDKAKATYEEYKGKLAGVDGEAKTLIERTKEDGVLERDRIIQGAKDYAQRLKQDVQTVISQEEERTRRRLQNDVARQALAAAEELIKKGLTDADRERLFEQSLEMLERTEMKSTSRAHHGKIAPTASVEDGAA